MDVVPGARRRDERRVGLALLVATACGRVGFAGKGDGVADAAVVDDTPRVWRLRTPAMSPPGLLGAQLAFDPGSQRVLLYGGALDSGARMAHLWAWDGATWSLECDPCLPGELTEHAMVLDETRQEILIWGGIDGNGTETAAMWRLRQGTFEAVDPGAEAPTARVGATLVWHPREAVAWLVGGLGAGLAARETWSWDGTAWTRRTASGPDLRSTGGPSVAWDARTETLVAFGAVSTPARRDTAFALVGGAWTTLCDTCTGFPQVSPSLIGIPGEGAMAIGGYLGSGDELAGTRRVASPAFELVDAGPPGRDSVAVAHDPIRDTVVIFGGNGNGCLPAAANCRETWEYAP